MDLKCNFQFQTQTQPPTITVGELFEAHCQAPAEAARLELTKLKVKPVDDATKYQLVVVRSAQNGDSINFAMTSYLVGPKDINVITLTDGTQDFVVQTPAPLKFEVKSILDPQQKPEMFGPITGLGIVIPMVYWVILGSVLVVALSTITAVLVSRFKRKRMLRRLESLDDGSQPIQQYFTNYRRLQREYAVYSARSTDLMDDVVKASHDAVVPAAEAGAKVIYQATLLATPHGKKGHWFSGTNYKVTGKRYWFNAGNLRASIYHVLSQDNTGPGYATFHISWNYRKAPYA